MDCNSFRSRSSLTGYSTEIDCFYICSCCWHINNWVCIFSFWVIYSSKTRQTWEYRNLTLAKFLLIFCSLRNKSSNCLFNFLPKYCVNKLASYKWSSQCLTKIVAFVNHQFLIFYRVYLVKSLQAKLSFACNSVK